MKVTITDKGDGYVTARFEAESNVETLILSTAALSTTTASVSISSASFGKPPKSEVNFGSFSTPTHELIDKKVP